MINLTAIRKPNNGVDSIIIRRIHIRTIIITTVIKIRGINGIILNHPIMVVVDSIMGVVVDSTKIEVVQHSRGEVQGIILGIIGIPLGIGITIIGITIGIIIRVETIIGIIGTIIGIGIINIMTNLKGRVIIKVIHGGQPNQRNRSNHQHGLIQ